MGKNKFSPNIAIPPGETLKDYLDALGMTQSELSKRIKLSQKTINEIIKGKAPITAQTALELENVFGTPAKFWLNLEANFQETKARIEANFEISEKEISIARAIPYAELSKLKYLSPTRNIREKVINLRSFFKVSSLEFIPKVLPGAFRVESKETTSCYALASWLQIGENIASQIITDPFDKERLKHFIPKFRSFTLRKPEDFLEELKEICASCGIVLILVPHLPKTYAHGATKWLTSNKVLVQLSIRRKFADIFWFSFFHELGHVILHGKKKTYIADKDFYDEFEAEADEFAANILVPKKDYINFIKMGDYSRQSIVEFAKKIEIHPCIVVGKLQHDRRIGYEKHIELKPKFCWKDN